MEPPLPIASLLMSRTFLCCKFVNDTKPKAVKDLAFACKNVGKNILAESIAAILASLGLPTHYTVLLKARPDALDAGRWKA